MHGGKAVTNAGQRKSMIADTADHVLRLPQSLSGNAGPRVEGIQPAQTYDLDSRCWLNMPGFIRSSEHQPEGRRQGSEFRRGHEGEIDLQSAGEQKYAV